MIEVQVKTTLKTKSRLQIDLKKHSREELMFIFKQLVNYNLSSISWLHFEVKPAHLIPAYHDYVSVEISTLYPGISWLHFGMK